MQVLSDGRVRRSRNEWQQVLRRFQESGLSEPAVCSREKISRGTFVQWKRRLRSEDSGPITPFIEVGPLETSSTPRGEYELTLPGGVSLRWKA
ncbi:MAG: hypothetical protein ACE5D3_04200 [Candidatus Binatia bacterium]